MSAPGPLRPVRPARSAGVAVLAAAAVAAAGLWLWINVCRFPSSSWNDLRLAPVFMALAGEPVYTLPGHGVITTWMYGPVPLWLWAPAAWASTAIGALLTAAVLNQLLTVAAMAATCAWWPVPGATRTARALAFAAAVAVWPDPAFRFLQADNVAVAAGLAGNLLLVTAPGRPAGLRAWLAAALTALALGAKQNALGLLLAQASWLAWQWDAGAAWRHVARSAAVAAAIGAAAVAQFGLADLWFGAVQVPAALPLAEDIPARLREFLPVLLVQWGAPLLAFAWFAGRRRALPPTLRLPALAWGWSLPLGALSMLTTGGSTNNLHGFQLLAIPLLLAALTAAAARRAHFYEALTVLLVALVFSARVATADRAPLRPATSLVLEAGAIAASAPGEIWLPWNPLAAYFVEHRFYHAEDGLYVRFITGHPVPLAQARAHVPPRFRAIAFPAPGLQWGVAAKLAPPDARVERVGPWQILRWTPAGGR